MVGIQEDNRLRFSFRNHFVASASITFLAVFFTILLAWFEFDQGMLIAFSLGYVINAILTLYLHIEYWLRNKGEEYEVHFDELIRYKNGEVEAYKVSEIESIKIYMSPALYRGSYFHFLGIEAYHYARVYLKTGDELVITCLLTPKIEKSLSGLRGIKVDRKKRLFNTLEWK